MAILNFPNSPSPGNTTTQNGVTWQWDGISWNVIGSTQNGYSGSVGYVGSLGYTGSFGYTGSVGYTGSFGYTGSLGPQGNTGYTNIDYGIIYAMRTY
jgi:hypothetical protein